MVVTVIASCVRVSVVVVMAIVLYYDSVCPQLDNCITACSCLT